MVDADAAMKEMVGLKVCMCGKGVFDRRLDLQSSTTVLQYLFQLT